MPGDVRKGSGLNMAESTQTRSDICLILPAYNEARTIASTLEEATAFFRTLGRSYQIIVAADGDDGTRERVREFASTDSAVRAIGQPGRHGKGKGIRDAVRIANAAIIGFADADNKVPIQEFSKLEPFLQNGYDVAIGSRGLERSQIDQSQPWYRRIGSRGFAVFMHTVVGLPDIHDTQCGFKFFHEEIAKDLFSLQQIDGYMFDVEILALAKRRGYRIREVPIRWHDDGDSRLQLFAGNVRNAIDIFKIRASVAQTERVPVVARAKANNG